MFQLLQIQELKDAQFLLSTIQSFMSHFIPIFSVFFLICFAFQQNTLNLLHLFHLKKQQEDSWQ